MYLSNYLLINFSFSFNRSEKRFEDFAICTFASDSKRKMCETAYQVFTRRNNFLNGLCGLLEREKRHLSGKFSCLIKDCKIHSNYFFSCLSQTTRVEKFIHLPPEMFGPFGSVWCKMAPGEVGMSLP